MKRKSTLLILGILYGICGITAAVICFGQQDASQPDGLSVASIETQQSEEQETTEYNSNNNIEETPPQSETQPQEQPETKSQTETVSEEEEESQDSVQTEEEKHYRAIAVDVGRHRLHIRDSASMEGNIIGYLRNGYEVEVLEVGDDWCLCKYGDIVGYVSTRYLKLHEIQEDTSEEIGVKESE